MVLSFAAEAKTLSTEFYLEFKIHCSEKTTSMFIMMDEKSLNNQGHREICKYVVFERQLNLFVSLGGAGWMMFKEKTLHTITF